jgi:hypothetical protein
MSYPGTLNTIKADDSPSIDAFSRWRVSNPILLVSSIFDYNKRPLVWEETLAGGASAVHDSDAKLVDLGLTTASGDSASLQTKEYYVYRTGQSQQIIMTFCLATPQTNTRQRVGYFDSANGIFLEADGTTINVVRRTSTSGSPVDSKVSQSNWNLDTLGAGDLNPSGLTLIPESCQIIVIDLQWLGVGRARIGFDIDGSVVYVHEFTWANISGNTTTYMGSGSLPLCYEITNTGTAGSAPTLKAICAACIREGSEPEPSFHFSVDTGQTPYAVGSTLNSILSIRLDPDTPRGALVSDSVDILVTGADAIRWSLHLNPTLGDTLTWADVTGSIAEYSTTNETVSGGTVLASGYAAGGAVGLARGTGSTGVLSQNLAAVSSRDGTPDVLVLAVQKAISGAGTSNTQASLSFREFRG